MTRMIRRLSLPLIAMALLSGCAGLESINEAGRPSDLFLLTPKSTFDPNLPRLRDQIVVEEPTATAAVSTDRIAVQPTPFQVQYVPRARWVDRAPLIVQSLLIESYENSGKVGAVGRSTSTLRADFVIAMDMREFQALVPQTGGPDAPLQVTVRLNMKIIDADFDRIIASRSFEEVALAESDAAEDIVRAFDIALGGTIRDLVEWSIRQMSSYARQG